MDRWKSLFWGSFVPLVVVQAFVLLNERYWTLAFADNTLHFMWGLCIFLFFVSYLRWKPLDALLGVIAFQIVWELVEIVGDIILGTPVNSLHYDPFFFDGIADTFVDVGGALIGWVLIRFTGEPLYERRVQRLRSWFAYLLVGMVPLLIIGAPLAVSRNDHLSLLAAAWIAVLIPLTALYALLHEPKVTPERRRTT